MGEKKLTFNPNWRHAGKLLEVEEVCAITGYCYDSILRMRRSGKLVASIEVRPYKFDPEHIHQVFFSPKKSVLSDSVSSLKTEYQEFTRHKPVKKEDLWKE